MTLSSPLRGIVPPVVTPLTDRDVLDRGGLERLLGRIVEAGCTGVFVLGSTGEAQALSTRLRLEVVQETCRFVDGRIPVLAGISDTSIEESLKLGRAAADAGVSALVAAPPFYFRMSQADLLRHAEALSSGLPVPLFLYNMPGLTKLHYDVETVRAASEMEGITGFKDSSGDFIYFQRVLRAVAHRADFSVFVGPEELLGQAIEAGAHGGVTGGANLQPGLYVELYRAAQAGKREEVRRLQQRVLELSERIYGVGDPSTSYIRGLKCALGVTGVCSDLPAAPLNRFTPGERRTIEEHLRALNSILVDA